MGFKDVKTLRDVIANKASNALMDDKTMLMERIIQVGRILGHRDQSLNIGSSLQLCPRSPHTESTSPTVS